MQRWTSLLIVFLIMGLGVTVQRSFATSNAVSELLPDGPGKDLIVANCQGCHSLRLVAQNGMSRQRWDETITWMQKTQNLWQFDAQLRKRILDYLSTYLGPSAFSEIDGLARPRVNPLPNDRP